MMSEEIVMKRTVKLNMLQLMKTNFSGEIKKNINLTEKRLDELRELKYHAQESMLKEEEDIEKVNNWGKELESNLLS